MTLEWNRCDGNAWCPLNTVNLSHAHFNGIEGVYIIWHGGEPSRTVRVGQGIIRDRLGAHRNDPKVQQYAHLTLYVTWAAVPVRERDGVEAYLAEKLQPLVGERFPQRTPIPVNLPW